MHHSANITLHREDDVTGTLQSDQNEFNQLLTRNSLIFKSSTVAPDPVRIRLVRPVALILNVYNERSLEMKWKQRDVLLEQKQKSNVIFV